MISHIFGCIWIFVGKSVGKIGWISNYEFENLTDLQLYLTALYFTFTTISTVGYGDISGGCFTEKVICIAYLLIGVGIYSFIAGSITSIIMNEEE
jgi:hypothetical protein